MVSLENRPFADSSSWNTPVSDTATFTKLGWPTPTGYNYSVSWDRYSPAVYVASSSDPIVQVTYPEGWGYPGGTVSVRMPAAANGAAGTDGELIIIDGDVAYNFWQFKRTSNTTATAVSFGAENAVTGDGWGSKSPFLSAGITAVGASQLGGLLVKDETNDGDIDHALQLVVDRHLVLPGTTGQAISSDGGSASGIVKEGQLLAIAPGTPMPEGLTELGQQVFKAMQQYGAYVVDVADGTTNIRAQSNSFDAATMEALWHDMGKITPLLQGVTNNGTGGSTGGSTGNLPPTSPTTPTTPTNPTTPTAPVAPAVPAGDTTAPTLQWVAANGPGVTNGTGTVDAGDTVRLSLKFSEAVNVTGTPTLAMNSNGTAKYVSGAGTDVLQFDYTVAAGEKAADLEIRGFNLSGVKDQAGNVANLSGAPHQPAGTLTVDTAAAPSGDATRPSVQWIAANGSRLSNGTGTVRAGDTVRLSVNFNEAMTVNGTPTLSLNSNGTAKYVGGAGTNTLQFDYKVGASDRASDLAVSRFNLGGVTDQSGNAVSLSGAPRQPAGTLAVRTSSSYRRTASFSSTESDLAAPATGTSTTDTSTSTDSSTSRTGWNNWFSGNRTLGFSGSSDQGATSAASDASVSPRLALLSQYSASSFAAPAATSTGTQTLGWGDSSTLTLAKPQA
ncbi:MAG TPA: hypothetical protein VIU82_21535 [Bosea sp. (in: a-proteobacteria)]